MKSLILAVLLLTTTAASAECYNYLKLGVGYKFQETDLYLQGYKVKDPISGMLELARQCEYFSVGIAHHSQPFSGAPFNKKFEYTKTEIFVAITFKF